MESGEWRRTDEMSLGEDAGRGRLAPFMRQWRQYARTHGRRTAAIALIVAFVLVFASQLFPWADVRTAPDRGPSFTVSIDDGANTLFVSYYLLWVAVLALAGATVYASDRARRPLFGAAMGAIVAQFIAIVPLLRHPSALALNRIDQFNGGGDGATTLIVTRQPGIFCAVVALAVLAVGMVLAVGGTVLPPVVRDEVAPEVHDDPPGEHVAVAVSPVEPAASNGYGTVGASQGPNGTAPNPSQPPPGYPSVSVFTVESIEAVPDAPGAPSTPPPGQDHSPYLRPLGNEQYRP